MSSETQLYASLSSALPQFDYELPFTYTNVTQRSLNATLLFPVWATDSISWVGAIHHITANHPQGISISSLDDV